MSKTLIILNNNEVSSQDCIKSVWDSMGYGCPKAAEQADANDAATNGGIWAIYKAPSGEVIKEVKLHEVGGCDYDYCEQLAASYSQMYPGIQIIIRLGTT